MTLLRPTLFFTALAMLSTPALADEKDAKDKPETKIETGKSAPDFTLKAEDGKEVSLSSFRGKANVLIAFYPKDFTGG